MTRLGRSDLRTSNCPGNHYGVHYTGSYGLRREHTKARTLASQLLRSFVFSDQSVGEIR